MQGLQEYLGLVDVTGVDVAVPLARMGTLQDPAGWGSPVDSVNRCLISVAKNGRYNELVTGGYTGL